MGADFSGYATKAGLKCSDGRTIMPHAFKEQDGVTVPLVWQHGHNEPANVIGHAILENREDGVYCYGYFNETVSGKNSKTLVEHKDIVALSIYANKLVEKAKQVLHGTIREVSLVLSGANPGALIDSVTIAHSDGELETLDDEAIIYTGLVLEHEDKPEPKEVEHATANTTIQDIYDSLNDDQKQLVHFMIGAAIEQTASAQHSDTKDISLDSNKEDLAEHTEGTNMSRNVFEQKNDGDTTQEHVLSHEDVQGIVADAIKGGSLKAAVESYALAHGINNIDLLFPDAKNINDRPEFDKRRTEWVAGVMSGTRHSPFSRIKTQSADLTFDEARAKGYIKGTLKKEEFFGIAERITTPTTIYKKQKLDRDDIVDITDFDVVAWLKAEMRMMLEEELARAILIGDGRLVGDEDKIQDGSNSGIGIRPIFTESELYATEIYIPSDETAAGIVDRILVARVNYKGTGTPTLYTKESVLTKLLLQKDTLGRRLYRNVSELASEMRVSEIVPVEVMEDEPTCVGIIVNLNDYVVGADKGGEVNMFDDFDIDYNQYKYLIETRLSGALVKIKAALILKEVPAANVELTGPTAPTFNENTNVTTIPTQANVVYKTDPGGATLTAGPQAALTVGQSLKVKAHAGAGFNFASNADDQWEFKYTP